MPFHCSAEKWGFPIRVRPSHFGSPEFFKSVSYTYMKKMTLGELLPCRLFLNMQGPKRNVPVHSASRIIRLWSRFRFTICELPEFYKTVTRMQCQMSRLCALILTLEQWDREYACHYLRVAVLGFGTVGAKFTGP